MPIEVTGRFRRRGGVYLVGELVECDITIQNIPSSTNSRTTNGEQQQIRNGTDNEEEIERDTIEVIQWCSAQIHCQEVINNHRVKLVKKPEHKLSQGDVGSGSTSFVATRGENGCAIYASKPSILCCDLALAPGQSSTKFYGELLPGEDIPPSFKGLSVKYLYKLTIGIQHTNTPVKLLRIPLRVLALPGLSEMCVQSSSLSSSNPALNVEQQHRPTTIDIANDLIETITAGKSQHTYNITNEHGKVCTLTLQKKAFKLGEDIVGTFDFSQAASTCSQFLCSLRTEETAVDECFAVKDQRPLVTTHATQHGFCLYYSNCELRIQIPLSATPSFMNDLVNVRWNLHFEFVISDGVHGQFARHPDGGVEWTAPASMDIHTMVWDLPIKVYACNPLHAANASGAIEMSGAANSTTIPLPPPLNGYILISFGTVTKGDRIPLDRLVILFRVLARFPDHSIIWQLDADRQYYESAVLRSLNASSLPGHIHVYPWLPLRSLMLDERVRVLITHGGLTTCMEAVDSGVPVLGVAIQGDQAYNLQRFVEKGAGESILVTRLSEDGLFEKLDVMIRENARYKSSAMKLRSMIRDHRTLLDRSRSSSKSISTFWIGWAARNSKIDRRRIFASKHHWNPIVYYSLDVLTVLASGILVILWTFVWIFRGNCD